MEQIKKYEYLDETFYLAFPIWSAVRAELSLTHYRLLLCVESEEARDFYINETINGN